MKKILVQFDSDRAPSVFDAITAYDAGVDVLLPYGGIEPREVRDLVYGAMFTRGPADLKNTAVFIGGIHVAKGEALLQETLAAFFGPMRVSVMLDSNGCNTTATAAVVKIISRVPVQGQKVVVLAGTGPVGQRAAALLAKEGAQVTLTSRTIERAQAACNALHARFGAMAKPAAVADAAATARVLEGACAVLCTGVEGVMLVSEYSVARPPDPARAGRCQCRSAAGCRRNSGSLGREGSERQAALRRTRHRRSKDESA